MKDFFSIFLFLGCLGLTLGWLLLRNWSDYSLRHRILSLIIALSSVIVASLILADLLGEKQIPRFFR